MRAMASRYRDRLARVARRAIGTLSRIATLVREICSTGTTPAASTQTPSPASRALKGTKSATRSCHPHVLRLRDRRDT